MVQSLDGNKVWWQAIVFCYSWRIKSPKHASLRQDIWVDNKIDVLFGRNMDLWPWMGLRGSMKPSSRERLSQNIKLLRIYRFYLRGVHFLCDSYLLAFKDLSGLVCFLWLVFSLCPDGQWQAEWWPGRGQSTGSPSVSRCQKHVWPLIGQRLLIQSSYWLRAPSNRLLMYSPCIIVEHRTCSRIIIFHSPDVYNIIVSLFNYQP